MKEASSLPVAHLKDQLDRDLIALLQLNARESTANLARKLNVARTTVLARLSRLEREGLILGYTVRLRQDQGDNGIHAHVGITTEARAGRTVARDLSRIPELRLLCAVSGQFDYLAQLCCDSMPRLDALLDEIGEIDGVLKTHTSVILAVRVDRR